MRARTRLGAAAAAAVLAVGGAVVVTASPAMAAPTIKLSSNGPFEGGDKVTVTLAGFSANAPIAVGLIPASRFPAEGPGDACASKLGCGALVVADGSGGVTKELTIVEGPIENSKAPAESCGPENACVMGAANIEDPSETVKVDITYVQATATPTQTATSTATSTATTEPTSTPTDTATALPDTGPTDGLSTSLLLGVIVAQIGLILAVRASRSRPRTRRAH